MSNPTTDDLISRRRILVADEDRKVVEFIIRTLREDGHAVFHAYDADIDRSTPAGEGEHVADSEHHDAAVQVVALLWQAVGAAARADQLEDGLVFAVANFVGRLSVPVRARAGTDGKAGFSPTDAGGRRRTQADTVGKRGVAFQDRCLKPLGHHALAG